MGTYYIVDTYKTAAHVHLMRDEREPVAVCGVSFKGRYATTHPVITGGALSCEDCAGKVDA